MTAPAPHRLRWAAQILAIAPGDEVLEIGCGSGVAVSLVCDWLAAGHITAIDRSAIAIERAAARNAEHVAAGTAIFWRGELAELAFAAQSFDTIFAVNVNLFWVRPAAVELRITRDLLRSGGSLHLIYETPGEGKARQVVSAVNAALATAGFHTRVTLGRAPSLVCISGEPAGKAP